MAKILIIDKEYKEQFESFGAKFGEEVPVPENVVAYELLEGNHYFYSSTVDWGKFLQVETG